MSRFVKKRRQVQMWRNAIARKFNNSAMKGETFGTKVGFWWPAVLWNVTELWKSWPFKHSKQIFNDISCYNNSSKNYEDESIMHHMISSVACFFLILIGWLNLIGITTNCRKAKSPNEKSPDNVLNCNTLSAMHWRCALPFVIIFKLD